MHPTPPCSCTAPPHAERGPSMTLPDGFHTMEDSLYGPGGDARREVCREDNERAAWPPELVAAGARSAARAREVSSRESERVLSLQRLMGGEADDPTR